jgi:hypothetical protein
MHVVQLLLAFTTASSLVAQVTVIAPTDIRATPQGSAVATLHTGAEVRVRERRGALSWVRIEGYLHRDLIGGKRDTFKVSVNAPSGARLRASPDAGSKRIAALRHGMGLTEVSRRGEWVRVRRDAWISTARLREDTAPAKEQKAGSVDTSPQQAPAVVERPPVPTPGATPLTPARETAIRRAPSGDQVGSLAPGAIVEPLARDREWVRVRVEGWVAERELEPADSSVRSRVSAADLRADPEGTRGVLLRWNVQILSPVQRADPLRRELGENEPYLIARGPDSESALLYLAVPPSLLQAVGSIPPLTNVVISGKVRSGRSAPVGVPILDLLSIVRR